MTKEEIKALIDKCVAQQGNQSGLDGLDEILNNIVEAIPESEPTESDVVAIELSDYPNFTTHSLPSADITTELIQKVEGAILAKKTIIFQVQASGLTTNYTVVTAYKGSTADDLCLAYFDDSNDPVLGRITI